MRTRFIVALAVVVLSALPAAAQGLNPFSLIAKYESDFNPTERNPTSTSSGLYGFLDSTWQQDLAAMGVSGPAHAYQASSSLQTAVAAYEIDQRSLGAWTCPNCDPKLVAALNANGGASAYDLSGLSTDPSSYASLDAAGGLQDFFGSGVATSTGPGASPSAPPTGAVAKSAQIFTFFYDEIMQGVTGQVGAMVSAALGSMWFPFLALAALALAVYGYRAMIGDLATADFLGFIIKLSIVAGLMSPTGWMFPQWIMNPILGLPGWMATLFTQDSQTLTLGSPASVFDSVFNGLYATSESVIHSSGWSMLAIPIYIKVAIAYYFGVGALVLVFLGFLFGNFLVFVLLIIAPFIIPGILFRATTGYVVGFINHVVTAMLTVLLINVVLGLYFKLIQDLMASFTPIGSPSIDFQGFLGLVVGLLIMGSTVILIPRLSRGIAHGVSAAFEGAARHASGGNIVSHASAAGGAFRHLVGG